ncbi:MAG: AAA family ATPase [Clostridiales bacterium]|nr:AAA family ATPase [Clostridiales bacterium]
MKPLKLVMSAFGSYADVQEINFSKIGTNGLYLICGETGSGKTTIFDAISFALYGKASGTSRDNYGMLRSDFAEQKAKTYVELDFISGDKHYYIKRSIKKSGQEVVLMLPDGISMSGERITKLKILEIVGLDSEQFAQIVMIAQNDFLRFLQSGTEERLKILRHIFGTQTLKQFQEYLKTLVKRGSDKRALILHDFARYDVDIYQREEQFIAWNAQIEADKTAVTNIDQQLGEYDKQKQKLAANLALAEELALKFTEFNKCQLEFSRHNLQSAEKQKQNECVAIGEIALHKVKPLADEAKKVAANHSTASIALLNAQKQETATATELAMANKALADLPPLAEAQEIFAVLIKEWETAQDKLKRIKSLQANRLEIVSKQTEHNMKQKELAYTLAQLSALPPLAERQSNLNKITADLQGSEEKQIRLISLQGDFAVIAGTKGKLTKEQSEFEALNSDYIVAEEKHRALEEAFLRSQAGIIANNLVSGTPCPVCGSTLHPDPARLSGEDISEAKLKKANDVKNKAQAKREEKSTSCSALKVECSTLSKRFMTDLKVLIPEATQQTAQGMLADYCRVNQETIKELKQKKNNEEKYILEIKTSLDNYTGKRDELTPLTASLKSEIDTLIKLFLNDFSLFVPEITWDSSAKEVIELSTQMKKRSIELTEQKNISQQNVEILAKNTENATKRQTNAAAAFVSAQTLAAERDSHVQKLLLQRAETEEAFKNVLQENGFKNEEDYQAALFTEGELAVLRKQIMEYEKKGEQLKRDLSRLKSETVGKKPPDMIALRSQTEDINAAAHTLGLKRDEVNGRLNKTESALRELRQAAVDFEKVEKAYAAVKQLADTANGKLDFETYAQMAYFERVLRAANLRLHVMSQNRYMLLRKTVNTDGRKRSGLELEVLDAYTGKTRAANSLSGGESFMASLSLALGLSDVVQQSAGGIRLDAMFIDEGFGTLDAQVLDLALRTLSDMAGTNRLIGIISHVSELGERIDKQIRVEKTMRGSKVNVVG